MTLLGLYAGLSLVAFIVYGWDKAAARGQRRRIPESTLHLLALLGGWPGGWLARHVFNHKTTKTRFVVIFWVTVLLNVATLVALLYFET